MKFQKKRSYTNLVLNSSRLQLKVLSSSSAPAVLEYLEKNRTFFKEWSPMKEREFYTLAFQKKQLKSQYKYIKEKRALKFWLFKKGEPEEIIGDIGFSNIVYGVFQSCHLGYKLSEKENNQGYITEGIQTGIEFIFRELKLHRIEANIMPRNQGSIRVVEKLGFEQEGLARNYLKINGKWEDHYHYVLFNKEEE